LILFLDNANSSRQYKINNLVVLYEEYRSEKLYQRLLGF